MTMTETRNETRTRNAERTGDRFELTKAAIRRGEIIEGCLVTLDHTRIPARLVRGGINGIARQSAPKKLSGRWQVVNIYQGGRNEYARLRRVGKRGQLLKPTANNYESMSTDRLQEVAVKVEPFPQEEPKAKAHEKAPEGAPLARKFSGYGPCIGQGRVVRASAKFLLLDTGDGSNKRMAKSRVHTEPCLSCTDHPRTQYPYGYDN